MTDPTPAERGYRAHVDAVYAHDLDALVAGYTPDALMFSPDLGADHAVARGREEIRRVFAAQLDAVDAMEPEVSESTADNVVVVRWSTPLDGEQRLVGVEVFVFADELIAVQTSRLTRIRGRIES